MSDLDVRLTAAPVLRLTDEGKRRAVAANENEANNSGGRHASNPMLSFARGETCLVLHSVPPYSKRISLKAHSMLALPSQPKGLWSKMQTPAGCMK